MELSALSGLVVLLIALSTVLRSSFYIYSDRLPILVKLGK